MIINNSILQCCTLAWQYCRYRRFCRPRLCICPVKRNQIISCANTTFCSDTFRKERLVVNLLPSRCFIHMCKYCNYLNYCTVCYMNKEKISIEGKANLNLCRKAVKYEYKLRYCSFDRMWKLEERSLDDFLPETQPPQERNSTGRSGF